MSFTAGIILLFLNIFIPGFLFLRFYFTGEFSKQFTTRIPLIRLSFYALVPGLLFQIIGLTIYDWCDSNFTIHDSLQIFRELMKSSGEYSEQATDFLKNKIYIYIFYTSLICSFAIGSGIFLHWLIRRFDLDINFKILRFRNHWYYVFSGDILRFEKYKLASSNLQKQHYNVERGIMMTFADLLVNSNGQAKKYSGYVMDYELDAGNIQNLSKLFLLDVQKYEYSSSAAESYIKKNVPGDLFVVEYCDVINMNITYVPSIHKIEKVASKRKSRRKWIVSTLGWLILLLIAFIFTQFVFLIIEIPIFNGFMREFNIISRIIFFLSILSLFSISLSDKDDLEDEKKKNERKKIQKGVLILNLISVVIIAFHYLF